MKTTEKAAYVKGLYKGRDISDNEIVKELIELVSQMAEQIDVLSKECQELREYIEEIDEDLDAVEEEFYGDSDDEDDEDDDDFDFDDDDDDDEDANFYEATCPSCGEIVCFDDTLDPDDITCPACGEKFSCVCDGDCEGCSDCCEDDDDAE